MLLGQILTLVTTVVVLLVTYLILKLKGKKVNVVAFKVLSVILSVVFVFRYMLEVDAFNSVFKLQSNLFSSSTLALIALLLNWSLYAAVLLIILYPFFATSKIEAIIKYFGLIVSILSIAFIKYITTGVVGLSAYTMLNPRTFLLGLEIGLVFAYSLIVFFEKGKFIVKKQDLLSFLYIIPMYLSVTPPYILQAIFGYANYGIKVLSLTFPHRVILYLSIIIPFLIFLVLRKKPKETIRLALIYISLGTLISFSNWHRFGSFLTVTNWPLHLCNTAMYIIPLCLILKWDKLFYFTYLINVLGAFIAMAMPNYSEATNLFATRMLEFYINHYIAFFMPIIIVSLKVYPRPKLKQFKYSMIGFGIYFLVVLICNAWFSNYGKVDYFFINSDYVADKLGTWAVNLRNFTVDFYIKDLHFVFYPVYQALFFLSYVALGAGVWFLFEAGYSFADTITDIVARKEKLKLDQLALEVALNGRSKEQPMNENAGISIILKNFSKRYGNSHTYAVKDANLEIRGGEIFGFLGHNGAGKSTIIKSIVGIQPITKGSIEVCGYDVDKQPIMAKCNIGYVPDHYALYEKLTGREYINYIADLYEVSLEDRNKAIKKYVDLFELNDAFDNQIKTYSHGMKQKLPLWQL